MKFFTILSFVLLVSILISDTTEQRITTIQLDGVQYFVSRMNPYSPELNFYLAYQYCRSLGLQLASFETREKADSITQYLSNAGYTKYDFWTSGNKLGTDMFLWMSTGLPFNATFNYLKRPADESSATITDVVNSSTAPQRTARESSDSGSSTGCVALKAPNLEWATDDCTAIKDFICEQTRCYYYNYGSIPVSSAQGKPITESNTNKPTVSSSSAPSTSIASMSSTVGPMNVVDFVKRLRSSSSRSADDVAKQDTGDVSSAVDDDNRRVDMANQTVDESHGAAEDDQNIDNASEEGSDVVEPMQSTIGPYDNQPMKDDPMANFFENDHDTYVSTMVPDYVTTFNSVHNIHESIESIL